MTTINEVPFFVFASSKTKCCGAIPSLTSEIRIFPDCDTDFCRVITYPSLLHHFPSNLFAYRSKAFSATKFWMIWDSRLCQKKNENYRPAQRQDERSMARHANRNGVAIVQEETGHK